MGSLPSLSSVVVLNNTGHACARDLCVESLFPGFSMSRFYWLLGVRLGQVRAPERPDADPTHHFGKAVDDQDRNRANDQTDN